MLKQLHEVHLVHAVQTRMKGSFTTTMGANGNACVVVYQAVGEVVIAVAASAGAPHDEVALAGVVDAVCDLVVAGHMSTPHQFRVPEALARFSLAVEALDCVQ